MNLTISEQFNSSVVLDSELMSIPETGLYLNEAHSAITVDNLLSFLPKITFTFVDFAIGDTYSKFETSRSKSDIVTYDSKIYQSLKGLNIGNTPDSSPDWWVETDIDSLRIKSFYFSSENRALNRINLNKRLITNQFIYNLVEINDSNPAILLPNDFAAWVFEPKGSDYVTISLNSVALQATTDTPQNLYVVNQGQLITTLTLNPNADGRLEFEDLDYSFHLKGQVIFAIDSQNVLLDGSYIDPLKYRGFVAYTASGIGPTPEGARYSHQNINNGLNFNISVHLDPDVFISDNLKRFGSYIQSSWSLDVLNMFLQNANNRINSNIVQQLDKKQLLFETKTVEGKSVAAEFDKERKKALSIIDRVFDTELIDDVDNKFIVNVTSV